jgi:hypothetical protein
MHTLTSAPPTILYARPSTKDGLRRTALGVGSRRAGASAANARSTAEAVAAGAITRSSRRRRETSRGSRRPREPFGAPCLSRRPAARGESRASSPCLRRGGGAECGGPRCTWGGGGEGGGCGETQRRHAGRARRGKGAVRARRTCRGHRSLRSGQQLLVYRLSVGHGLGVRRQLRRRRRRLRRLLGRGRRLGGLRRGRAGLGSVSGGHVDTGARGLRGRGWAKAVGRPSLGRLSGAGRSPPGREASPPTASSNVGVCCQLAGAPAGALGGEARVEVAPRCADNTEEDRGGRRRGWQAGRWWAQSWAGALGPGVPLSKERERRGERVVGDVSESAPAFAA